MAGKRPLYRYMVTVVNDCVRRNMGKAVFVIFLYNFIQSLFFSVSFFPLMLSLTKGEVPAFYVQASSFVLLALALVADGMLTFGLFSMMSRMCERAYVTMGFLFYGFKSPRRKKVFLLSLVTALIQVALALLLVLFVYLSKLDVAAFLTEHGIEKALAFVIPVYLVLLLLLLYPLSMTHVILYLQPELSVWQVIKKSISLVTGNFFHYTGYLIFAMGVNLPFLVIVSLLQTWIPSSANGSGGLTELLSLFLHFVSFVLQLVVLVRLYCSIPVYVFSLEGKFVYSEVNSDDGLKMISSSEIENASEDEDSVDGTSEKKTDFTSGDE